MTSAIQNPDKNTMILLCDTKVDVVYAPSNSQNAPTIANFVNWNVFRAAHWRTTIYHPPSVARSPVRSPTVAQVPRYPVG